MPSQPEPNSNSDAAKSDAESQPHRLPPGQQFVGRNKWPIIGEREPLPQEGPWQLEITGQVHQPLRLTIEDLNNMPQTEVCLDIHCVTRWSKYDVTFGGVLLSQLLDVARPTDEAKFISFIAHTERAHSTSLTLAEALEHETLIATKANGIDLAREHGGPIRNIVPRKYFYKSVKWLCRLELLTEDRLGYWEAETGYHNHADPWKEERFMAPNIDRRTAARLMQSRDFTGPDLRSINASDMDLSKLNAHQALLRNADFRRSQLSSSNFREANLSNAHFQDADLSHCDFTSADLEGANLAGANLSGAILEGASLFGASFCESFHGETPVRPAVFDNRTKIDVSQLDGLTEDQLRFVKSQLARLM